MKHLTLVPRSATRKTAACLLALALLLSAAPSVAADGTDGKVNVNEASAEQLTLLPRIGPSIAERIVEFRKENGPFKQVEDLLLVRGIGDKTLDLMKPYVAVSGATTLEEKVRSPRPASSE